MPKDEELDLDRADFAPEGEPKKDSDSDGDATATQESRQADREPAACALCRQRIVDRYFEVNDKRTCPRCTETLRQHHAHGAPGAFGRAALFGLGGGILGAALYYAVALIAGAEFGIIAIVVGILVGKGVRRGAGLHRHWLYPALGMGLTYLSIVSTYVPEVLKAFAADGGAGDAALSAPDQPPGPATLLAALAFAAIMPVLMLVELEIWGPIILAIGLWEGWRYGKAPPLEFRGPFGIGTSSSVLDEGASRHDTSEA